MALSTEQYNRYDSVSKFLSNPATNPDLAILQKASKLSVNYAGNVPGGRLNPLSVSALKLALEEDGIPDPITGKIKKIPGYIGKLTDNLFQTLGNDKSRLQITLNQIKAQRDSLEQERVAKEEQRAYLRNLGRDPVIENPSDADTKKRLDDILEKLGLKRAEKSAEDKTTIGKLASIAATEKLAFDGDGDHFADYKDITSNLSLSTRLKGFASLTLETEVNVTEVLQIDPPATTPTHVVIKHTGARETYVDNDDGSYTTRARLKFTRGNLSLNGQELAGNVEHTLTWQEFQSLKFTSGKEETLDSLSVIAFNDTDGSGTLNQGDERGEFQSVILQAKNKVSNSAQDNGQFASVQLELPNGASGTDFRLRLQGSSVGSDFLEDLNAGRIELYVYEWGYPTHQQDRAKVDLTTSNGNELHLKLDKEASDSLYIQVRIVDPNVSVSGVSLIP